MVVPQILLTIFCVVGQEAKMALKPKPEEEPEKRRSKVNAFFFAGKWRRYTVGILDFSIVQTLPYKKYDFQKKTKLSIIQGSIFCGVPCYFVGAREDTLCLLHFLSPSPCSPSIIND